MLPTNKSASTLPTPWPISPSILTPQAKIATLCFGYLLSDATVCIVRMHGAYGLATPYVWGTAETATGVALTCLLYAKISGDKVAAECRRRQRDFILGCNPFGLSCLIGRAHASRNLPTTRSPPSTNSNSTAA